MIAGNLVAGQGRSGPERANGLLPQKAEENPGLQVTDVCSTPGKVLNRRYGTCLGK